MSNHSTRVFILGMLLGGLAGALFIGGAAAAWGWHQGNAARVYVLAPARPVGQKVEIPNHQMPGPSPQTPGLTPQAPALNPKEFIPFPNNGNDRGPGPQNTTPGFGGQDCDKILFFYQGRLYQLRPGPTPRNGGNPEFFFMQPYQGPQIPGFPAPSPEIPGIPGPNLQPLPPTFKF